MVNVSTKKEKNANLQITESEISNYNYIWSKSQVNNKWKDSVDGLHYTSSLQNHCYQCPIYTNPP